MDQDQKSVFVDHAHKLLFAIFVQHCGFHGFTVLGAQLENMPHFYAAFNLQHTFAIWTGVASNHIANVGNLDFTAVSAPVYIG